MYQKQSNNNSGGSAGGIGFCGLLTILFIALKLLNVIHWRWLWVLAPIWIPIVLIVVILCVLIFGSLVKEWMDEHE